MNRSARSFLALLGMTTLLASSPSYALAASYVDEVVSGLQHDNVYVAAGASLDDNTREFLSAEAAAHDVAVVVLPDTPMVRAEGTADTYVTSIAGSTSFDTIVVAIGNDLEAGSRVLPDGRADAIALDAELSAATAAEALTQFIEEVQVSTSSPAAETSSVVPYAIGGSAFLVLAAGAVFVVTKRRGRTRFAPADSRVSPRATPEAVRDTLREIRKLAEATEDTNILAKVDSAEQVLYAIFAKLAKDKNTSSEVESQETLNLLEPVRTILENYVGVTRQPLYYRHPEEMKAEGRKAIGQYQDTVLENIRRLNDGMRVDYSVALRMIDQTQMAHRSLPRFND